MSTETFEGYLHHPVFQSAMTHFQNGEWELGLAELDQMVAEYPLNHQLRALRQEMRLRAQVDVDEVLDLKRAARQKRITWAIRLLVLVFVLGLAFWSVRTYSTWLQHQWGAARQKLESEFQVMELAVKFRDAQDLLQIGRPAEAKVLFEEIAAKDPDYPGLADALEQTQKLIALEEKYEEALRQINLGDITKALELFEAIEAEEPFYKDVAVRITEIKGQFFLGDILAQAEKAYEAEDWEAAATRYETLRALNPLYQTDLVEEHLFKSYMNAAVKVLAENQTMEALDLAEEYFRKALALRPQDPVIRLEREQARQSFKDRLFRSYVNAAQVALSEKGDSLEALAAADEYYFKALELYPDNDEIKRLRNLAHLYITALEDFSRGRWSEVITSLEEVYAEDPDYALGTARQTLYEAYIARGDVSMISGDYESALNDFQRAAVLAEEGENVRIRLYQAQIRIAEARGALLDYENAVLMYQAAIDQANLGSEELREHFDLMDKLNLAESYAQGRNFRAAYRVYRDAARKILLVFPTTTYVVQAGDYLTMLARRYNTTVEAILQANNIGSARRIIVGQELVIPTSP